MRAGEFDEPAFLARLRGGEGEAWRRLVHRFHASLVRLAASIIGSQAQAEEVTQDSWLAAYQGVARFEGRSSLVTWLFSIVMNRARTRVAREGRLVGLDLLMEGTRSDDRGVPLSHFKPDGHWAESPKLWDTISPERVVSGRQLWDHALAVIEILPAGQRAVLLLRDMEGRDADETCALLEISAENQRVLLHRARCRVRAAIDRLVGGVPGARPPPGKTPAQVEGAQVEGVQVGGVQVGGVQVGGVQVGGVRKGRGKTPPGIRRVGRMARSLASAGAHGFVSQVLARLMRGTSVFAMARIACR